MEEAIQLLSRNRTCLVVARHRGTVENADKVVLVYRGRVIEQGTHEELLQQRMLYYMLTTAEQQVAMPEL